MKKAIVCLLLIIFPMMVFADAAGPSVLGYDAVIINKNGAKSEYENGKTIPYNTKIRVYDEDNEYADVCILEEIDEEDDCDTNSISIKDIAPLKDEILPKDLKGITNRGTVLDKKASSVLISNKDGVKLSKGPALVYGKYDKVIPYKTILKYEYNIDRGFGPSWIYIDDAGYKGWINEDIAFLNDGIIIAKDTTMIDDDGNETIIPAETEIEIVYTGYENYFVEYNGIFGSFDGFSAKYGYKGKLGYILTLKNTNIISKGKIVGTIPKDEKIKILYAGSEDTDSDYPVHSSYPICKEEKDCYFYIEYKGTKGFVNSDDVVSLYYEQKTEEKKFNVELEMYDINKKNKTGVKIPANTTITVYLMDEPADKKEDGKYYNTCLIKYNNELGYVYIEKSSEEENNITPTPIPEKEDNNQEPVEEKKEDNKKSENPNKTNMLIIYCVAGAVILSLTTIVIIKLINRKKKQDKVEPTKEESKVNVEEPKNEEIPIEPQKKEEIEEKEKKE